MNFTNIAFQSERHRKKWYIVVNEANGLIQSLISLHDFSPETTEPVMVKFAKKAQRFTQETQREILTLVDGALDHIEAIRVRSPDQSKEALQQLAASWIDNTARALIDEEIKTGRLQR